jgi:phospholipid transport system substrate-binding protein
MAIRIFSALVALTLSMSSLCLAETPSPKVEIKNTIDSIIATVQANPGDAAKAARREKLREIINPKFDFDEMSRRSLGSNWTEITPAEQKDFTTVFSELLARTYLSKIETVKPGMVKVESEQVEGPKAVVKTVVLSQGDTFPIDYKMMYREGGWRVYDVVIENIGLVANYRNEFSGIIRKDKFSGLMEKLRAKVK